MRDQKSSPVYWLSPVPTTCELEPYLRGIAVHDMSRTFYDCSIPSLHGMFECICPSCFTNQGCRTGLGKGQKYEKRIVNDREVFLKTEG